MEQINVATLSEEQRTELFAALREQYNPDGSKLRNYQLHLSHVLAEFDKFCKEHDITYYLAFGTLLGAIRHKGFIPWDDDADIWMDRDNYNKLAALMHGEHNVLTDYLSVHIGIRPELWAPPFTYIDIFILDRCPDNVLQSSIKRWAVTAYYILRKSREKIDNKTIRGGRWVYKLFAPIAILAPKSHWVRRRDQALKWFLNGKAIGSTKNVRVYNDCLSAIKRKYPSGNGVWDVEYTEFEGYEFPIPKGYDECLKIVYGDYMSLPKTLHTHGIVDMI